MATVCKRCARWPSSPALKAAPSVFAAALKDSNPRVQLEAMAAFFDPSRELPFAAVMLPARSTDSYLRQTAGKLLARRAALNDVVDLLESPDATVRLIAVLAAGFRLTAPPPHSTPPSEVALSYPKGNAFFQTKIRFGDRPDEPVELHKLGRIGSYTTAEMWKAITPDAEQKTLFGLLARTLKDSSEPARLQAAYFLSLLRDPGTEPAVAHVFAETRARRLADVPVRDVAKVWVAGPFAANDHTLEAGPIDLTTVYVTGPRTATWKEAAGNDGAFTLPSALDTRGIPAHYLFFRFQSAARHTALFTVRIDLGATVWHNGRLLKEEAELPLDLQPGSNDILIRVAATGRSGGLHYRAPAGVVATLPEKSGAATLAPRLKEGALTNEAVLAEFLTIDWALDVKKGDPVQGRKLFGSFGCARCHAIVADQTGGGGPSLTDAGKRFNTAYLVESILLPSKQVADQFRSTRIVTTVGQVVSGVVVSETAEAIELLLPDATRRTLRKTEIEERALTAGSPMPAGVVRSPAELRDLLAYLISENPLPP